MPRKKDGTLVSVSGSTENSIGLQGSAINNSKHSTVFVPPHLPDPPFSIFRRSDSETTFHVPVQSNYHGYLHAQHKWFFFSYLCITLMLLLIARTKFSDFSGQSHYCQNKYSKLINSNNVLILNNVSSVKKKR